VTERKWFFSVICIFLSLLIGLSAVTFFLDPFYFYRFNPEEKYLLNTNFSAAGLIKSYPYDSVIVGSSMVQNFNMDSFRTKLNCSPLKVAFGGLRFKGLIRLMEKINERGTAENFFIATDQHLFAAKLNMPTATGLPEHLYDDSSLNDYRYLLGYEALVKYIPTNAAIGVLQNAGVTLPDKFARTMSVELIGYWQDDFTFGKEIVKRNYLHKDYAVSKIENDNLKVSMRVNFEKLLDTLELNSEKSYTLFFPPYSALHWAELKANSPDVYVEFLSFKDFMYNECSKYDNISVFDFQTIPEICNLDLYKDSSHYDASLNEFMVDCFKNGMYKMDENSAKENEAALELLIDKFHEENADWFNAS